MAGVRHHSILIQGLQLLPYLSFTQSSEKERKKERKRSAFLMCSSSSCFWCNKFETELYTTRHTEVERTREREERALSLRIVDGTIEMHDGDGSDSRRIIGDMVRRFSTSRNFSQQQPASTSTLSPYCVDFEVIVRLRRRRRYAPIIAVVHISQSVIR